MRLLVTIVQQGLAQLNKETMELTFTFTEQEATYLLIALQEIPAKLANPLSDKIRKQAQDQLPKQDVPADAPLANKVVN
jgi:hypothetical protein